MNLADCLKHQGVVDLLNTLVDRLDRLEVEGKESGRSLSLDSRTFPALYKAPLEAQKESLWECLEFLQKLGWIELRLSRGYPGQARYELRPRVLVLAAGAIREATNRAVRTKSPLEMWREAVMNSLDASAEVRELVGRFRIDIPSRSPLEIVQQLNRLPELRDQPLLLREVSARLFWGGSKHLDSRQELIASMLNVDVCPFPEMPVQLQAFLPAEAFSGVLFIENLATFEQALRHRPEAFAGLALVYASGFKGSAKRIRSETGSSLFFADTGTLEVDAIAKLRAWLRDGLPLPSWFWGDLDFAGMEILRAMRKVFPDMEAWRAGYAPMLADLLAGGGHAPGETDKSAQRVVTSTGCAYADSHLIPALIQCGKFVDQESVRSGELASAHNEPLPHKDGSPTDITKNFPNSLA